MHGAYLKDEVPPTALKIHYSYGHSSFERITNCITSWHDISLSETSLNLQQPASVRGYAKERRSVSDLN